MKRLLLVIGIAAFLATQASSVDRGPGGVVYWNTVLTGTGGRLVKEMLYRSNISTSWVGSGTSNFDNVPFDPLNTYNYSFAGYKNVEVYDPHTAGGAGKLLVADIYNETPPSGGYTGNRWRQPWDIVAVNPATDTPSTSYTVGNGNLYSDGKIWNSGVWDSFWVDAAMAAPKNWGGKTSNNLSILQWSNYNQNMTYLWDANGNGTIDNTTTEGKVIYTAQKPIDVEFGNDQAVYNTYYGGVYNAYYPKVDRTWLKGDGTSVTTTYFAHDCATGGLGTNVGAPYGMYLAVGPGNANNSKPIVYLFTEDNNSGVMKSAIFALQDGDGDNKVTFGNSLDIIKRIWETGQNGITIPSENGYAQSDIEIYVAPDNQANRMLVFAGSYGGLYGLNLWDNGLAVKPINGVTILPSSVTNIQGFELDMNGPVPEPATVTLFGTGALGAIGWMRRRRVK